VTSHFWKYVPFLRSFSFITTVTSQADATQCPGDELPPAFFAGMERDVDVRDQ
jgi:hypothetical protein